MFGNCLVPTFIEVYGRSIRDHSLAMKRNLNVEGLDALDLRTMKANCESWDFNKQSDRREARALIKLKNPLWLIGSPPCTAFCIWNYAMNFPKMDQDKVQRILEEGRRHFQFHVLTLQDANRQGTVLCPRTSCHRYIAERSRHPQCRTTPSCPDNGCRSVQIRTCHPLAR